jgi:glycopeptide antibiotics resistance protein
VGIEVGQLLLPSRFPSTADVLLNSGGAALGAAAVAALSRMRGRRAIGEVDP